LSFRPDRFTSALLVTVVLASLVPASGAVARFFEGYHVFGRPLPWLVSALVAVVFALFVAHAALALRKPFPAGAERRRALLAGVLVASGNALPCEFLEAREVFVGTMGVVYAIEGGDEEDLAPVRQRLKEERWPDGRPVYSPLVCVSLMMFYVFAMQCMSTLAITRRETNSWRWPLFQLVYMTATAYLAALFVYQVGSMLRLG
jgi:hypothetical protein